MQKKDQKTENSYQSKPNQKKDNLLVFIRESWSSSMNQVNHFGQNNWHSVTYCKICKWPKQEKKIQINQVYAINL